MNPAASNTADVAPEGYIPLPRSVKQHIKDAMVALAMANWCFIRIWANAVFNGNHFLNSVPVSPPLLAALAVNILGLALFIWLGIGVWRRSRSRIVSSVLELLFILLLVFPLDYVRTQVIGQTDAQTAAIVKQPLMVGMALVVFILVVWKSRPVARGLGMIMGVTLPVALLTMAKILLASCNAGMAADCPPMAGPPPFLPVSPGRPRVVWIIFDETDYRLAFPDRPSSLALPEFDRLRAESLCADHAYAPADMTIVSMPALIFGHRLEGVAQDQCDLSLHLTGSSNAVAFSTARTVFSDARDLGMNTALVGWFVPYGRLLGASLNYCKWYAMPAYQPTTATNFGTSMQQQVLALAWPLFNRKLYIDICQNSLRDALAVAGDRTFGMMLLHLSPPHSPGVWLPEQKRFTSMGIPRPAAYFNNLALADSELGALRQRMEATGEWDKTWVILSADHSWRKSKAYDGIRDYRVPYLIKPPGSRQSGTYSNQFNTVLTRELIGAILHQQVTDQTSAAAWLDKHLTQDMPATPANGYFE